MHLRAALAITLASALLSALGCGQPATSDTGGSAASTSMDDAMNDMSSGSGGAEATGAGGNAATGAPANSGGSGSLAEGGSSTELGAGASGELDTGSGAVGGAGSDPALDLSRELYDPALFPRFDFDLPAESVAALSAVSGPDDPAQDTYVTGTFTYDRDGKNEVVQNVGFRLKGEGSFKPFAEKPAWKIKFDELVADQRFRGLARMTFNNAEDDPAFVAERLAYDVYRAAGVPAPRCNSAVIYVNGDFYGVYNNVENEDKHLIARWFADNDGNLYEKNGMRDFTRAGAADFELETNEAAGDRSDLDALIGAIEGATNPDTFLEDVGTLLNMDEWLMFTAVEGVVNEWDAYSFTLWYPHNFRIYADPATGTFSFIPWGNDMAMQPAPARVTDRQFVSMFELTRSQDQPRANISSGILFQRCLASAPCKAAYTQAIQRVISVWEGLGMEEAALRYYEQVKAQVYLDTRKVTETSILTNAEFEAAFQAVLGVIRGRVDALRADLAN